MARFKLVYTLSTDDVGLCETWDVYTVPLTCISCGRPLSKPRLMAACPTFEDALQITKALNT